MYFIFVIVLNVYVLLLDLPHESCIQVGCQGCPSSVIKIRGPRMSVLLPYSECLNLYITVRKHCMLCIHNIIVISFRKHLNMEWHNGALEISDEQIVFFFYNILKYIVVSVYHDALTILCVWEKSICTRRHCEK